MAPHIAGGERQVDLCGHMLQPIAAPFTAHETKGGLTILLRSMLINLLSQGSVLIAPPHRKTQLRKAAEVLPHFF